jgi:hypothetical protein
MERRISQFSPAISQTNEPEFNLLREGLAVLETSGAIQCLIPDERVQEEQFAPPAQLLYRLPTQGVKAFRPIPVDSAIPWKYLSIVASAPLDTWTIRCGDVVSVDLGQRGQDYAKSPIFGVWGMVATWSFTCGCTRDWKSHKNSNRLVEYPRVRKLISTRCGQKILGINPSLATNVLTHFGILKLTKRPRRLPTASAKTLSIA